ncbi:MAG: hypothetical protein AB7G15_02455 [Alphaproteobacteria bacterium]
MTCVAALSVSAFSCQETIKLDDLTFDAVWFQSRLRPDLLPLDSTQAITYGCRSGISPCPHGESFIIPHISDTHFDDGGDRGNRLVTALIPPGIPAGPLNSADPGAGYKFPVAPVIWVKAGEARLSYEAILRNPAVRNFTLTASNEKFDPGRAPDRYTDSGRRVRQISINSSAVTLPGPRNVILAVKDGDIFPLHRSFFQGGFFPSPPGLTMALIACTDGPAKQDASDPPVGLTTGCTPRAVDGSLCSGGIHPGSLLPWTAYLCRFRIEADSSFHLAVVASRDLNIPLSTQIPGTSQNPSPPMAHVKVVSGVLRLVRQINFVAEECRMLGPNNAGETECSEAALIELNRWRLCTTGRPIETLPPGTLIDLRAECVVNLHPPGSGDNDFARIRSQWRFNVKDVQNNFAEHFSPELAVTQIKVFTLDRSGNRRYVRAEELGQLQLRHPTFQGQLLKCDAENEAATGHAVIDVSRCEGRRTRVNPAFPDGAQDFKSTMNWDVFVQVQAVPQTTLRVMTAPGVWEDVAMTNVIVRDLLVRRYDKVFVEFFVTDRP